MLVCHIWNLWTRKRLNHCELFRQTWQTCQPWWEDEPYRWSNNRSKVKVTMDTYVNKIEDTIKSKLLCVSLSDMLTMVRGWILLILELRDQRSRSPWSLLSIIGCAETLSIACFVYWSTHFMQCQNYMISPLVLYSSSLFEVVFCFMCGHRRMPVNPHWMMCLFLERKRGTLACIHVCTGTHFQFFLRTVRWIFRTYSCFPLGVNGKKSKVS